MGQQEMSTQSFLIRVQWSEEHNMYCATIDGISEKFYSRYALWAKAHALRWYADELVRIKTINTPLF